MKTIYILVLLSISTLSFSQNWNLVNQNKTVFFQHSDSINITNTIVIDSTLINGTNTNYYTGYAFKYCDTCQGFSTQTPIIYRYAKELLGFSIEDDVTNNQYNLDNNTIKQHAQLNDNWVFSTNLNATIVNTTELLILGILDSVKTIQLSNSDTIIISKNNGVIRYPDFENAGKYYELVGYHEGQDSYGDYLPNFWSTYDFNVGDVFFYQTEEMYIDDLKERKIKIKIIDNLSTGDTISYNVKVISLNNNSYGWSNPPPTYSNSITNFSTTFSIKLNNNQLENGYGITNQDTPQSNLNNSFYYPILFHSVGAHFTNQVNVYQIKNSSTFGTTKTLKHYDILNDSLLKLIDYSIYEDEFANNFGRIYQSIFDFEFVNTENLVGTIINGDTTGTIYNFPDDLGFEEKAIQSQLSFYPNPANNEITINIELNAITIYNNLGQLVLDQNYPKQIIDVSSLPQGLYFIKGIDTKNKTLTSKLIIK